MKTPLVVNINRLHRQTSAVVEQAAKADQPTFVTQFACVSVVLLPRRMYDRLLRAAERGEAGAEEHRAPGSPPQAGAADPLRGPLAVFGPLPRGTRFQTKGGFSVDAELAELLMEDGEELTPILRRYEDEEDDEDEQGGPR